jgi:hypothetical protein
MGRDSGALQWKKGWDLLCHHIDDTGWETKDTRHDNNLFILVFIQLLPFDLNDVDDRAMEPEQANDSLAGLSLWLRSSSN